MNELDLSQDTLRQRRNVVVISVLLIFIDLGDVSFGNTLTFLGATLSIGEPEIIHTGIVLFMAYFVWRFYQYFSTDNAYSALFRQFGEHMKIYTRKKIVHSICRHHGLKSLKGEYSYKNLTWAGGFKYSIEVCASGDYNPIKGSVIENEFTAEVPAIPLELFRLGAIVSFAFRARILTDYFVPYVLVIFALYLEFV